MNFSIPTDAAKRIETAPWRVASLRKIVKAAGGDVKAVPLGKHQINMAVTMTFAGGNRDRNAERLRALLEGEAYATWRAETEAARGYLPEGRVAVYAIGEVGTPLNARYIQGREDSIAGAELNLKWAASLVKNLLGQAIPVHVEVVDAAEQARVTPWFDTLGKPTTVGDEFRAEFKGRYATALAEEQEKAKQAADAQAARVQSVEQAKADAKAVVEAGALTISEQDPDVLAHLAWVGAHGIPAIPFLARKLVYAIRTRQVDSMMDYLSYADNKGSRTTFTRMTGVKLPPGQAASREVIAKWRAEGSVVESQRPPAVAGITLAQVLDAAQTRGYGVLSTLLLTNTDAAQALVGALNEFVGAPVPAAVSHGAGLTEQAFHRLPVGTRVRVDYVSALDGKPASAAYQRAKDSGEGAEGYGEWAKVDDDTGSIRVFDDGNPINSFANRNTWQNLAKWGVPFVERARSGTPAPAPEATAPDLVRVISALPEKIWDKIYEGYRVDRSLGAREAALKTLRRYVAYLDSGDDIKDAAEATRIQRLAPDEILVTPAMRKDAYHFLWAEGPSMEGLRGDVNTRYLREVAENPEDVTDPGVIAQAQRQIAESRAKYIPRLTDTDGQVWFVGQDVELRSGRIGTIRTLFINTPFTTEPTFQVPWVSIHDSTGDVERYPIRIEGQDNGRYGQSWRFGGRYFEPLPSPPEKTVTALLTTLADARAIPTHPTWRTALPAAEQPAVPTLIERGWAVEGPARFMSQKEPSIDITAAGMEEHSRRREASRGAESRAFREGARAFNPDRVLALVQVGNIGEAEQYVETVRPPGAEEWTVVLQHAARRDPPPGIPSHDVRVMWSRDAFAYGKDQAFRVELHQTGLGNWGVYGRLPDFSDDVKWDRYDDFARGKEPIYSRIVLAFEKQNENIKRMLIADGTYTQRQAQRKAVQAALETLPPIDIGALKVGDWVLYDRKVIEVLNVGKNRAPTGISMNVDGHPFTVAATDGGDPVPQRVIIPMSSTYAHTKHLTYENPLKVVTPAFWKLLAPDAVRGPKR